MENNIMTQEKIHRENETKVHKMDTISVDKENQLTHSWVDKSGFRFLLQDVRNRAIQRFLIQGSEEGAFDLDDETTALINSQRGGGQSLDSVIQARMAQGTDYDFSSVRVHTSPEVAELNRRVNAVAFTTGQDIFFSEGVDI